MNFKCIFSPKLKFGRSYNSFLRSNGSVPGIIYGESFYNRSIYIDSITADKIVRLIESNISLFNCELENDKFMVICREITKHPLTAKVLHFDLQRVSYDSYIKIDIPLDFIGYKQSPGILAGGYLVKYISHINVKCRVSEMPKSIPVDLSLLSANSSIFLNDIILPTSVTSTFLLNKNKSRLIVASVIGSRSGLVAQNDKT